MKIIIAQALFVTSLGSALLGADLPATYFLPAPPGQFMRVETARASGPNAFAAKQPIIATTYFYWYDVESGAHILDGDGSDALTTHPPTLIGFSYKNAAWHKRQLQDMAAAGIDVAMPVYWGAPDGSHNWSDKGLPKLLEARSQLVDSRQKAPAIGMFYDTSTLQHNQSGFHVDLTTQSGRQWFYGTIRNFFSQIPPRHRALVDGKPLVYLYASAFARKVDDKLFPAVQEMFQRDFGTEFFLVKSSSWPGKANGEYEWGAALDAKFLDTAAIGPGYNHAAVPGRTPLVRERDDGRFYGLGWARLLSMDPAERPWLVHLETWNEFHEGTDICESKEYGRKYIDLTREFAAAFHAKKQINPGELSTTLKAVSGTPDDSQGLTVPDVRDGDGPIVKGSVAGRSAWTTTPNKFTPGTRYMYFDVDSNFFCNGKETLEVIIDYLDSGPARFHIEYDSGDPALSGLEQRFRHGPTQKLEGKGEWAQVTFKIPFARFTNRANNFDFRLVCTDAELSVSRVGVRRARY
jgi:hypothetical protein